MKILDVQELRKTQFDEYRKRRTSQFIKFLDKDVDFVTYYSINKAESTFTLENNDVDQYIGPNSPIRYNKINNLPVYGITRISDENSYDETDGGFTNESYEGEVIFLPNIIEPCEGDAFILNVFNENRLFVINQVTQTILKSKPHYVAKFHIEIPEYIEPINKQVVKEFNAIFDNIGTEDKVIISNEEYNLREQYKAIYKEFSDYYVNAFFKKKLTLFEVFFCACTKNTEKNVHYIDKFLQKFMEEERIIVMDKLFKETLMLDYNSLYDHDDYLAYKKTLYWAIQNKDISNIPENANFISIDKVNSPFALTYSITPNWYFTSEDVIVKSDSSFGVDFDFSTIVKRYIEKDTSFNSSNPYSKILSIIVNYLCDNTIMPGYFYGIIGNIDIVQEYELYPVILYIIREQIDRLTKLNTIL